MGISERIELRHLRAFLAVAEELNFRAAAERMHLTQPPLTRTISQLEGILGVRLFHRSTRTCELTEAGAQLLPCARKVMTVLRDELPTLGKVRRKSVVRLGVCFAIAAVKLPRLRTLVETRLGVRVDLELRRSHELARMLLHDELDAAVVLLPAECPGVRMEALARAQMMAALPAAHPLAERAEIAVRDLAAFSRFLFLSRRENPLLFDYLNGELARRGLQGPRYVQSREAFEGLAQIAAGVGCSLLCETLLGFTGKDVVLCPLRSQDAITVDIGLLGNGGVGEHGMFEGIAQSAREFLQGEFGLEPCTALPAARIA